MDRSLIALDFDGVCVENAFPDIGEDMPGVVETLNDLYEAHYRFTLWTVRENGSHSPECRTITKGNTIYAPWLFPRNFLDEAVMWFVNRGIKLDAVNNTPSWRETRILYGGRKVLADIIIDDMNLGGFKGWDWVREELL